MGEALDDMATDREIDREHERMKVAAAKDARISYLEHALDEVGHWIHSHGCADDQPILTHIEAVLKGDQTSESTHHKEG